MNMYKTLAINIGEQLKTFDPFKIAEFKNIEVKYKNFDIEPKGEAVKYFDRSIILLDISLKDIDEKYFVCAHELCHALEHTELATYYISNCNIKNKFEYQADQFAIELLTSLYQEQYDIPAITKNDLQIAYGIPEKIIFNS